MEMYQTGGARPTSRTDQQDRQVSRPDAITIDSAREMATSNELRNPCAMNPAALDHSKADRCPDCGKPNGLNGYQAMNAPYSARLCNACYNPDPRPQDDEHGLE